MTQETWLSWELVLIGGALIASLMVMMLDLIEKEMNAGKSD